MTRFLIALCALALASASALADGLPYRSKIGADDATVQPFNWTGLYIGGLVGYGVGDAEFSNPVFNLDGISGDGWRGNVKGGLNWQPQGTPFVLRGFACYNFGSAEATLSVAGPNSISATHTPEWCVGGGMGLAFAARTMLYGDVAWERAKGELSGTGVFLPVKGSQTSDGLRYAIGLEHKLTPNLGLAAEWSMGQHEYTIGTGPNKVNVDVNDHVFGLRLNVGFGFFNQN